MFRSVVTRASKLGFRPSRAPLLPAFTASLSSHVARLYPTHAPGAVKPLKWDSVGKPMPLPKDILASSREDLLKVFRDVQRSKRSLSTSQVFEIWRMIYDKSYPSLQEKLYRFTVFEMNLDKIIKQNKMGGDKDSTSKCYWGLNKFGDLTEDERMKAYGLDVPPVFSTREILKKVLVKAMNSGGIKRRSIPGFTDF